MEHDPHLLQIPWYGLRTLLVADGIGGTSNRWFGVEETTLPPSPISPPWPAYRWTDTSFPWPILGARPTTPALPAGRPGVTHDFGTAGF